MTTDFDVIIAGSGPAGVSAAFPLLAAGYRVLMLDGGQAPAAAEPDGEFLDLRRHDPQQWHWMIGREFQALQQEQALSPKLRIPTHSHVFAGFHAANRIAADDFMAVGSLAPGGLSNAWGCGVAALNRDELKSYPFAADELLASYATVAQRMGLSGAVEDDMADYFGLDAWAQQPVPLDTLQGKVLTGYGKSREKLLRKGLRLGRSRVAVLSADKGERKSCNLSGNCLWGCQRRSMYTALEDLALLKQQPGFHYLPGKLVENIAGEPTCRIVSGRSSTGPFRFTARKVVLAAGTLATTRLALNSLGLRAPRSMQACPTAAFLLWLPALLGSKRESAFALGQLSFALTLTGSVTGFGSLFSTTGIPVADFVRYLPLRKRFAIDLLAPLLSSCVVGNFFLPGHYTEAQVVLAADGQLRVSGQYRPEVPALMHTASSQLRSAFARMHALVLPGSFSIGKPGSDIHYAGTLPMRDNPGPGETNAFGEIAGLTDVHVVDGACLNTLTEKSHTLTLMANADRIGKKLASLL